MTDNWAHNTCERLFGINRCGKDAPWYCNACGLQVCNDCKPDHNCDDEPQTVADTLSQPTTPAPDLCAHCGATGFVVTGNPLWVGADGQAMCVDYRGCCGDIGRKPLEVRR